MDIPKFIEEIIETRKEAIKVYRDLIKHNAPKDQIIRAANCCIDCYVLEVKFLNKLMKEVKVNSYPNRIRDSVSESNR